MKRLNRGAGKGAETAVADLGRDLAVGPDDHERAAVDTFDLRPPAHFGQRGWRSLRRFARPSVSRAVPL